MTRHAETAVAERNCATAPLIAAGSELHRAIRDLGDWTIRWGEQLTAAEQTLIGLLCGAAPASRGGSPASGGDYPVATLNSPLRYAGEIGCILADYGADADTIVELAAARRQVPAGIAIRVLDCSLHARALASQAAEAGRQLDALIDSLKSYRK